MDELTAQAVSTQDSNPRDEILAILTELGMKLLVEFAWTNGDEVLAVVKPSCDGFSFAPTAMPKCSDLVLSRFAYIRRDSAGLIIESPEALCQMEISHPKSLTWLHLLLHPTSVNEPATDDLQFFEFVSLLWCSGFLDSTQEAESPSRASWEFHDLLFHWRTRSGRLAAPQCDTSRFRDKFASPSGIKSIMASTAVEFPESRGEWKIAGRRSLIEVLESRRTNSEQGDRPITVSEVSSILYHAARIRHHIEGDYQDLYLRSVPAAGAIQEIEFYVAVGQCNGLSRGLYHYHSHHQKLFKIAAKKEHVSALLNDAAVSWAKPHEPPQVLIVLASRFPRLAWKYEGIAYRLTLLNAGVILQTMYLLATELGLACSAIGGGDTDLFAEATGIDPFDETSVAEFALGSSICRQI